MLGSYLCCYINENSFLLFYYIYLSTSPAPHVIYSIKFIVFNFLSANFLAPKNGHCRQNQLALKMVIAAKISLH